MPLSLNLIAQTFGSPLTEVAHDILAYQSEQSRYDKYVHDRLYDLYEVSVRYLSSVMWSVWIYWGDSQPNYETQSLELSQFLERPTIGTWAQHLPQKLYKLLSNHPDSWVQSLRHAWKNSGKIQKNQPLKLFECAKNYLDSPVEPRNLHDFMAHYRNKLARGHGACLPPTAYQELGHALEQLLCELLTPFVPLFSDPNYVIARVFRSSAQTSHLGEPVWDHIMMRHPTQMDEKWQLKERLANDHWYLCKKIGSSNSGDVIGDFGPLLLPLETQSSWMINDSKANANATLAEYLSYPSGHFKRQERGPVLQRLRITQTQPAEPRTWEPKPPRSDDLFQLHLPSYLPISLLHAPDRERLNHQSLLTKLSTLSAPVILIEGPGGYGKTELCRLLFNEIQSQQGLPIYLRLRNYHPQQNGLQRMLAESLGASEELSLDEVVPANPVLLLDGLNEVDSHYLNACRQEISLWVQHYPHTQMVILGRNWYQELDHLARCLDHPYRLQIQPQSPDVVAAFFQQYLSEDERAFISPQVNSFLQTPFLILSYLCLRQRMHIHSAGSLLRQLTTELLLREQQQQGWSDIVAHQLQLAAQYTANYLSNQGKLQWYRYEYNEQLSNIVLPPNWPDLLVDSGLWQRVRDANHFEFSHQLLQESCTADAMSHMWHSDSAVTLEQLLIPDSLLDIDPMGKESNNLTDWIAQIDRLKYEDAQHPLNILKMRLNAFGFFVAQTVAQNDRLNELLFYVFKLLHYSTTASSSSPLIIYSHAHRLLHALVHPNITTAMVKPYIDDYLLKGQPKQPPNTESDTNTNTELTHIFPQCQPQRDVGVWAFSSLPYFQILEHLPPEWIPWDSLVNLINNYPNIPPNLHNLQRLDPSFRYRMGILRLLVYANPEKTWQFAMDAFSGSNNHHFQRFLSQIPAYITEFLPHTEMSMATTLQSVKPFLIKKILGQLPPCYHNQREFLSELFKLELEGLSSIQLWGQEIPSLEDLLSNDDCLLGYSSVYCLFLYHHNILPLEPLSILAVADMLNRDYLPNEAEGEPLIESLIEIAEDQPPQWILYQEGLAEWFKQHHLFDLRGDFTCVSELMDFSMFGSLGAEWLKAYEKHPGFINQERFEELFAKTPTLLRSMLFEWLATLAVHQEEERQEISYLLPDYTEDEKRLHNEQTRPAGYAFLSSGWDIAEKRIQILLAYALQAAQTTNTAVYWRWIEAALAACSEMRGPSSIYKLDPSNSPLYAARLQSILADLPLGLKIQINRNWSYQHHLFTLLTRSYPYKAVEWEWFWLLNTRQMRISLYKYTPDQPLFSPMTLTQNFNQNSEPLRKLVETLLVLAPEEPETPIISGFEAIKSLSADQAWRYFSHIFQIYLLSADDWQDEQYQESWQVLAAYSILDGLPAFRIEAPLYFYALLGCFEEQWQVWLQTSEKPNQVLFFKALSLAVDKPLGYINADAHACFFWHVLPWPHSLGEPLSLPVPSIVKGASPLYISPPALTHDAYLYL